MSRLESIRSMLEMVDNPLPVSPAPDNSVPDSPLPVSPAPVSPSSSHPAFVRNSPALIAFRAGGLRRPGAPSPDSRRPSPD